MTSRGYRKYCFNVYNEFELFPCGGADRRTDMMKLIYGFSNCCVDAPKNKKTAIQTVNSNNSNSIVLITVTQTTNHYNK